MTRYVAANVHDNDAGTTVVIPLDTADSYDAAMQVHVKRVEQGQQSGYWRPTVLLDTGSIAVDDDAAMRRLLDTDPLLRAVFDLGRTYGYEQGRQRGVAAQVFGG